MRKFNRKIVLANGKVFYGNKFGYDKDVVGEVVFNTSICGYQEVLTDPSYNQQIVVMTFPIQGAYGINDFNNQSNKIEAAGFVVNDLVDEYSNSYAKTSLEQFLIKWKIPGIFNVAVRDLASEIRKYGSIPGKIADINEKNSEIIFNLNKIKFKHHVKSLNRNKIRQIINKKNNSTIIFYDLGSKTQIIHDFERNGINVIVVPYSTKYKDLSKYKFDAVFLSNGPGDPEDLSLLINEVKLMIKNNLKIFGICLGHQIICLALGLKMKKLKFGHHSTNHPVIDKLNNKIIITSQNHNYSLVDSNYKGKDISAFYSLNDDTNEGIYYKNQILTVQFHPEASPGPNDGKYIFVMFKDFLNGKVWKKEKY